MIARIDGGLVYRTVERGHDPLIRSGIGDTSILVSAITPDVEGDGLLGRGMETEKLGVESIVLAPKASGRTPHCLKAPSSSGGGRRPRPHCRPRP